MKKVFISYSRKNLRFAEQLAQDIAQADYAVWYDLTSIAGGDNWAREIEQGIQSCEYMIVVLSPDSIVSKWVERETLYAINLGKK